MDESELQGWNLGLAIKMKRFTYSLIGISFALTFGLAWLSCNSSQEKVLFNENFTYPDGNLPENWWSEGNPAYIREGRLFVDADTALPRVSTVWLDRVFSGNLSIEFDVHILSSDGLKNNMNFFLLYSSPDGKSLRDSRDERKSGNYPLYHKLNGYIFTHLADGNEDTGRFRFRYNPGFNLLHEIYTYECKRNKTYKIKIEKNEKHFKYWTDGILIFEKTIDENQLLDRGIIGFRTFHTCLWWDNLTVSQIIK
jgi:hypothetical protein